MIATTQCIEAVDPAEIAPAPSRLWGLTDRDLHDRMWASRGIRIVRRGSERLELPSAQLYLLLEPEDLVLFDLGAVLHRFRWVNPRAARLRIVQRDERSYTEVVESDDQGAFRGVRRLYRARAMSIARAWLTPDRQLADRWTHARSRRELRILLSPKGGVRPALSIVCDGHCSQTADADDAFRLRLLERWKAPGAVLDGVYQYGEAVWVHESIRVPRGTKLVGPLWLGAGVELLPGETVVGPAVVPDEAEVDPPPLISDAPALLNARILPRWRPPRVSRIVKRAFDIAFSLLVILATLPLYPLIMMAIFLEDGAPFFFSHRRQTLGGREFPCWKFRTMCRSAEKLKAQLAGANTCDGPQFFIENDPRLLRIGHTLRRYQLDELPQFWNVLLGHMSVVGPRPSPDKENQYCPSWREARLSVRPGITGLWQVRRTRKPETDFQEWIRYDLEYVQHQSFKLDLWIIVQTALGLIGSCHSNRCRTKTRKTPLAMSTVSASSQT